MLGKNGVIIGKDGYLFLADGGHSVLQIVTGKKSVEDLSFTNFNTNIGNRAASANSLGVQYRHILFPDKQSVLRRQFVVDDPICLADLYKRRCPQAMPHVLDLTEVLRRQSVAPFMRTDTHLTDLGAIVSACSIAESFSGEDQAPALAALQSRITQTRMFSGDLGKRFDPNVQSEENFLKLEWPLKYFTNDMGFGNDGLVDIYISPNACYKTRLLWFGDSFGRGCVRMLSFFYEEIIFLRTRFFHEEIFRQIHPNIVITQNIERYMDFIESDDEAPPFLMYPALKGIDYSPSKSFAEAFAAILSFPRRRYIEFIEKQKSSA